MRALALEHLHSNPIGVYGDVLEERGICGTDKRLHVHHRTYGPRGREKVEDLMVLCEDCHLAVHTGGGSHRPSGLRSV